MNSRLLASCSKRRLLAGGINGRTMTARAPVGRISGNATGTVRSLHSSLATFSSVDALDMADTFAHRHSKFCPCDFTPSCCLILCLVSGISRDEMSFVSLIFECNGNGIFV